MFNIKGEIKVIGEAIQITETFRKRDFVIVDNSSQYPQYISFQLTQDRCSVIDGFKQGQEVVVSFNIRGREWTDQEGNMKYFNSLDVCRIETQERIIEPAPILPSFLDSEEEEVLPF